MAWGVRLGLCAMSRTRVTLPQFERVPKAGPTNNNVYDTGHTIARQDEPCKKKQQRKIQQQSRKTNRKKC